MAPTHHPCQTTPKGYTPREPRTWGTKSRHMAADQGHAGADQEQGPCNGAAPPQSAGGTRGGGSRWSLMGQHQHQEPTDQDGQRGAGSTAGRRDRGGRAGRGGPAAGGQPQGAGPQQGHPQPLTYS